MRLHIFLFKNFWYNCSSGKPKSLDQYVLVFFFVLFLLETLLNTFAKLTFYNYNFVNLFLWSLYANWNFDPNSQQIHNLLYIFGRYSSVTLYYALFQFRMDHSIFFLDNAILEVWINSWCDLMVFHFLWWSRQQIFLSIHNSSIF